MDKGFNAMTAQTANPQKRLLCRAEVMKKTNLASATISQFMETGNFPKPHQESAEVDLWRLSDIEAWIYSRKKAGA